MAASGFCCMPDPAPPPLDALKSGLGRGAE